ncbi:MAG: DMT family transporter [Pseudomonadota bacterium]
MNALRNPHLLLTITVFIWGGNAVAGKFAVGHISPMVLTLSRWAIALAIVAAFAKPHMQRDWAAIRTHWVYLLLMGGIGYTAFNFFLYSALQYTSAINVALEQSAMPVVIFVLNYLIYRTGITWLQVCGYLLTLVGVIVTVSAGDPLALITGDGGTGVNRGDILMIGAALCYGGYSVALRSKPQMHWLSFLTCLVAGALLFSVFGVAFEYALGNAQMPTTLQGYLVALYAGIFPSLVAQGFFIAGVAALGANRAGLYINLVPVFAALLAVSLLSEKLQLFHAVAFVLVVGGIMIAQRNAKQAG